MNPGDLGARKGRRRIVAVTAYDAPTARLAAEAGVDLVLVGDSLGPVVLGLADTLDVTMDDMARHTEAAARGLAAAGGAAAGTLLAADMPHRSCATPEAAAANARRLAEAGAAAVKIETHEAHPGATAAIVEAGIPVIGHVGLNPQAVRRLGGYKVRGRAPDEAARVLDDARGAEAAGAFAVVVEAVPAALGAQLARALAVPVIGIGAGPDVDGQILVLHDVIGLPVQAGAKAPRFVRRYADAAGTIRAALERYAADVRSGAYPSDAETYR